MVRISSSSMGRGLALVLLIGLGILTPLEALAEEDQAARSRQTSQADREDSKPEAEEPQSEFELIRTPFEEHPPAQVRNSPRRPRRPPPPRPGKSLQTPRLRLTLLPTRRPPPPRPRKSPQTPPGTPLKPPPRPPPNPPEGSRLPPRSPATRRWGSTACSAAWPSSCAAWPASSS